MRKQREREAGSGCGGKKKGRRRLINGESKGGDREGPGAIMVRVTYSLESEEEPVRKNEEEVKIKDI